MKGAHELKKEIGVLMLLSAVLLSGCGSDKSEAVTNEAGEIPSNPVTTESTHESDAKLIAASEKEEVKIYALKETEGVIERVNLDINGQQKEFDWKITDTGNDLKIFYTDLTGDGKPEAVIVINTGRGTNLNINDIHVINAGDLSEIKVSNAVDVAKAEVDSKVVQQDNALDITVNIRGKEYKTTYPAEDENYSDKLIFGAINTYSIENHKIVASVAGNIKTIQFVGSVLITYSYDSTSNEFKADQITFDTQE
jgi:hypothetical protein